jgi:hypothetical protein
MQNRFCNWEELTRCETFGLTEFQIIGAKAPADHFIQNNEELFPLTDRTIPNFVLSLGKDWDSFKSGLKRNIKESLRRCYNAPKRDGLEINFRVAQGCTSIRQLLPVFYTLHGARASAKDTIEHPDYFSIHDTKPCWKACWKARLQTVSVCSVWN